MTAAPSFLPSPATSSARRRRPPSAFGGLLAGAVGRRLRPSRPPFWRPRRLLLNRKPADMKAEPKPKTEFHPIEAPRTPAEPPDGSVAALEAALAMVENEHAAAAAAMETAEAERAEAVNRDGPSDEVEAEVESIDNTLVALKRKRDIAAARKAKLAERLAAARDAEAQKAKRRELDEVAGMREAFVPRQTEFLERFTGEWRALLRESCALELRILAVNKNLPDGAAKVPSVDLIRRIPRAEPKVEVRRTFFVFTGPDGYFAEEGACTATKRADGKYDCARPNGSTGALAYAICDRIAMVDVATTTRRPHLMSGALANEIAIPCARDGDPAGWTPVDSDHPALILQRLDRLEFA